MFSIDLFSSYHYTLISSAFSCKIRNRSPFFRWVFLDILFPILTILSPSLCCNFSPSPAPPSSYSSVASFSRSNLISPAFLKLPLSTDHSYLLTQIYHCFPLLSRLDSSSTAYFLWWQPYTCQRLFFFFNDFYRIVGWAFWSSSLHISVFRCSSTGCTWCRGFSGSDTQLLVYCCFSIFFSSEE